MTEEHWGCVRKDAIISEDGLPIVCNLCAQDLLVKYRVALENIIDHVKHPRFRKESCVLSVLTIAGKALSK